MARILVVDDEPHIRELVRIVLELRGHTLEEAHNGRVALEIVEQQVPELIILDLAMPEMDGWRFLEELHFRDLRRHTRVIIISGHVTPEELTDEQRGSVRHFVTKPFDPDEFAGLVESSLAQAPDDLYQRMERTDSLVRLLERMDDVMR